MFSAVWFALDTLVSENSSSDSVFDGGYPGFLGETKTRCFFCFVLFCFIIIFFLILVGFRRREGEAQQNSDVLWP